MMRWLALTVLILFTAYTFYCARTENFWASCKKVWALRWGVQVTADLYIGLFLFTFLIYLNSGSLWIALLWLGPTFALGNIVPLLYFVIYYDSIVSHFVQKSEWWRFW